MKRKTSAPVGYSNKRRVCAPAVIADKPETTVMAHRLDEYTPLRIMRKHIDADDFNRIRLALLRESLSWHIVLPRMPCVLCILEESAWICVDECQNNQPILAWTDFNTAARNSLDAPVECQLRLYHIHAGLVMGMALDALVIAAEQHRRSRPNSRLPISKIKE